MRENLLLIVFLFSAFMSNAQGLERNTFNEIFTSSTCGPCNPGNVQTNNVWANSTETPIVIKYQMSWPGSGDPYYTAEGQTRRSYYNVNSVPYMMIDGGWNGNSNSYTSAVLNQYSAVPAYLDIASTYEVIGQTVNIEVAMNPLVTRASNNILHVAILEKKTFNNVKSNGETEFENVMKKMLPNANGTGVGNLIEGQSKTFKMSYTFQGSYRLPANASSPINHGIEHSVEEFTDLEVVAWVQNNTTREVYHAAYSNGNANDLDISLPELTTPTNVVTGSTTPIEGMIINNKSTVVTSFDVTYKINGGFPWKTSFAGLNIAEGDTFYFAHPKGWIPSVDGSYTVEVFADNINGGGVNTFDDLRPNNFLKKVINASASTTSLSQASKSEISIYPNPASQVVFLQNSGGAKTAELYNSLGEKVATIELAEASTQSMDINNLKQGIYLLKIISGSETSTERLVIK